MKVLITGGLGFAGTNLALYYIKKGWEVFVLDNMFKELGCDKNLLMLENKGAKHINCDIADWNEVREVFEKNAPFDAILHMAAQVAFKRSVENPRLDFEINALGTFNMLEGLRLFNDKAVFVCASTNQVYGEMKDVETKEFATRYDYVSMPYGLNEEFPLDFLSPYGCSKGAADQYTIDYARVYNLKAVVTRFGGIYGTYQYSYEDHGWVSFISQMVMEDKEFNRFGHGKQVCDILYVDDLVEAIVSCVDNIDKVKGEAINIAGGPENTMSVLELITLLEELTGNKEKSIVNDMRKADKLVCYRKSVV